MPLDRIIADATRRLRATLRNTATNARTEEDFPCRVRPGQRVEHLEGLPAALGLLEWEMTLPAGTDLIAGDVLTVPDKGTYLALRVHVPESEEVAAVAYCLQQLLADGEAAIATNTTVRFVSKSGQTMLNPEDGSPNIPVYLFPQTQELVQGVKLAQGYTYVLVFDNRRRFPLPDSAGNPVRIQANDGIICDLFGQQPELLAQSIGITNPIPRGVLPVSQATFVVPS